MKKETQLSVLKEIRDLLKPQSSSTGTYVPMIPLPKVWTLHVPAGMTIEKALAECKVLFSVWRWNDQNLDKLVTSDRTTAVAYTIKFKANIEADEEYANKSADDLSGSKGITLLERILLELQYFKETGLHLDIQNVTLCSGSRYSGGNVPTADWSGGKFGVGWSRAGSRFSDLRSRVCVL